MKPKTAGRDAGSARTAQECELTQLFLAGDRVPPPPQPSSNALLAGALILTQDGELPVEFLGAGDRVITRDAGLCTLRALRSRRFRAETATFAAGSLGHTRPDRETVLLASQEVLVRDWRAEAATGRGQAMIAARDLVDGKFITLNPARMVTVYEVDFGAPHVIYADGLELAAVLPERALTGPA